MHALFKLEAAVQHFPLISFIYVFIEVINYATYI